MSKQGKRKITVDLPKHKDVANRPSVFERLGTKKKTGAKKPSESCRQWALHGTCAYGKNCKFAFTHTLISPSKQRAAIKDSDQKRSVKEDPKSRLHSTVIVRGGRSPDGEIDNWDQNDLEYADTDVLEKRRQQLQRELELQLKMDSSKDMRKDKKKPVSSSSSSRSSSSSSLTSSSSDGSSSSSSSGRDRRKGKKGKLKRNSSSSSDGDGPTKKKLTKNDSVKRDTKNEIKKTVAKKDDKILKKHDGGKRKIIPKTGISKKSLSPGKKSGGTPPITLKPSQKTAVKHSKSPLKKEKNRSISPHSMKDKERGKTKEKEKEKERDRVRVRSRSPRKGRSRTPRRPRSISKDNRRKESSERSRPVSPKKKKDESSDRHKKRSLSKDRSRERKDRSIERRKDKHEEKDRHDRKPADRARDRAKDNKREDPKRRGRGLGSRGSGKGLEKPNKPMERLLPRPEERLAALAAISNRALETDKSSTNSKDKQDNLERGRKGEKSDRDRSGKRDRLDSLDRDQGEYGMERQYEHGGDHYDRADDRYSVPRDSDRSPAYARERHYDQGYEMPGPSRGYPDDGDRIYGEHLSDHRGPDLGYDERRPHRDRSWEGRSGSVERDRGYIPPHKDWDNDDYRTSDWGRDRHWHEQQMSEWGDKEQDPEVWRHRGPPPGPHRGRMHGGDYRNQGGDGRQEGKRRVDPPKEAAPPPVVATPTAAPPAPASAPAAKPEADADEKPIPDDLSEISDDPDDILNRDDMMDQDVDEDSQPPAAEENVEKQENSEKESTQDTSAAGDEKEEPSKDDEDSNLGFEEISDAELEEERTRAGLGDALGVDWASLVADVRRREQAPPPSGVRDRWRPERVLAALGLSVRMAGERTVGRILQRNRDSLAREQRQGQGALNGQPDEAPLDVKSLHPVAVMQVAEEHRKRQRAALFGSGVEISRALSAGRDLALRRHLCRLPAQPLAPEPRPKPPRALFEAAKGLLLRPQVSG